MPTSKLREQVVIALQQLRGLKLSRMALAADMRTIQFGTCRPRSNGMVGEYALHIQCPWRLERGSDAQIVTGSRDLYEPYDEADWKNETFNWENGSNLQEQVLRRLLQGYDHKTKQIVNATGLLVVEAVEADVFGGFRLDLSGDYQFRVFPCTSREEAWRLFKPTVDGEDTTEAHFVVPTENSKS